MRTATFMLGFMLLMGGIILALYYSGILERIGTVWTVVGLLVVAGIGIMAAANRSPTTTAYLR
jgi:hypothetical protein